MATMKITLYECENGWAALYGSGGERLGEFGPDDRRSLEIKVHVVHVPIDSKHKDFPTTV